MAQVVKKPSELQMKQNKLEYIRTEMQESHKFVAWLNYEFDKMGIKCKVTPAQVSMYLKEFHNKAQEELDALKEQKNNNNEIVFGKCPYQKRSQNSSLEVRN